MFDCSKYEYVNREIFLRSWTTWQVYMANCLYQYTFKCQIAACSQQRGDEDTASSQSQSEAQQEARVVAKVQFSAEERTTFQETKVVLCSIFWQVSYRDADRISIINVGTVPLAIYFVFDAWVPYFFILRCPLTQLEVIAIASSPIATGNRSQWRRRRGGRGGECPPTFQKGGHGPPLFTIRNVQ